MSGAGNPAGAVPRRIDGPSPGLLEGYRATRLEGRHRAEGRWPVSTGDDEVFDLGGAVRSHWGEVAALIDGLGPDGLRERREQVRRLVEDDGVTYGRAGAGEPRTPDGGGDGDGGDGRGTPWQLDPLPMVLGATEWDELGAGLRQRAELLDLLQADLYGASTRKGSPRSVIERGLVPPELVFGHAGFLRACDGITLPGPRQLPMVSTDVARLPDGWCALGDRTQAPSGAGFAMENRRIVSRVLPALYRDTAVRRLRPFFDTLRSALEALAPPTGQPPRVVVLSPGPGSETSFDQAFLSMLLGFPLVEGQDLTVREGRVWLRSLGRPEPVDVVLRRVDGWFCDPLQLRADSRLGVPGLLQAARQGTVSIVNPPGSGVLENPGLVPFLPALSRALLGEELRLAPVPTWWCGDPASLAHVLARLDRLVVRPIARGVGRGSRFGWELSVEQLARLRARIAAQPHAWCAQEPLAMSTVPVATRSGLEPRRVVLRGFAVAVGSEYHLMAGGLARIAARPDGMDVSAQVGGLAKDVWVLDRVEGRPDEWSRPVVDDAAPVPPSPGLSSRVADDMFWLGRYAERAEDAARVLRVAVDLAADHARRPGSAGATGLAVWLRALASITGTPTDFGDPTVLARPQPELVRLAADAPRPGTLAHAVRNGLRTARAVREQLSNDTWLVLGGLDRALLELGWAPEPELHLQRTLSRVLEGLLAFAGLAAENMVRDAGWYVMDAGRRIERSLQVCALLRHTLAPDGPAVPAAARDLVLESVLIGSESVITYRRRHPGRPRATGVLGLLLFDRDNPRGVLHQLLALADDLHRLPAAGPGRHDPSARLRTVLAGVRDPDPRELARELAGDRAALGTFLDGLTADLEALADAVADAHFARPVPPRPLLLESDPGSDR